MPVGTTTSSSPSTTTPYFCYHCLPFSSPQLAVTRRLANLPRCFLVVAESQCGLASLKNTGTLQHFEATKNAKSVERFLRGGHGTFAPSRGGIVTDQHQPALLE